MLVTITNEQKVQVTLAPKTQAGNPAQLEAGSIKWEVLSGDATTEVVDGDELSIFLVSGAAGVNSQIQVTADADLGEGVVTLTDMVDLAVVQALAGDLGLVAGSPVLK